MSYPNSRSTILQAIVILCMLFACNCKQLKIRDTWEDEYKLEEEKHKRQLAQKEQIVIIAPKILRPNSDYSALINLNNSQSPAQVSLRIIGRRINDQEKVFSKDVQVLSDQITNVKFPAQDWPNLDYALNVSVVANDGSWNFSQEESIDFMSKTFSTFIQTDKAIYKPGQKIQFRIITVDSNLKPVTIKNEINITITDSKQNVIKQWLEQSTYRGMLSLETKLSEDPNLGDWTIKVTHKDQEISKTLTIAEYVLPNFDVEILLPNHVTYNTSKVNAKIRATYTYGKPVNGKVSLTVQSLQKFRNYVNVGTPLSSSHYKSKLSNGIAEIPVNLIRDLKLKSEKIEREIEFVAVVEENFTDQRYNATKVIKIHDKPHRIEHIKYSDNFKPGLNYTILLKVSDQDGNPVPDDGPELMLSYGFSYERDSYVMLKPFRGIIEYTISTPNKVESRYANNELTSPHSLVLEAAYAGQIYYLSSVSSFESRASQFLQIILPVQLAKRRSIFLSADTRRKKNLTDSQVQLGEKLLVQLLSTEPMNKVTCQGISRGSIVWAINIEANNKTQAEFSVDVDHRLLPSAKILCYYVRSDMKEIVADSITFPILGSIKNPIALATSAKQVGPGQAVDISVETAPNALVGILGVDQSVLLMKKGNDIEQTDIERELKSYGTSDAQSESHGVRFKRSLNSEVSEETPYKSRGSNSKSIFDDANVIILTNNYLDGHYFYPRPHYKKNSMKFSMLAAAPQAGAVFAQSIAESMKTTLPDANAVGVNKEQLVLRKYFPETWLWANATASKTGNVSFNSVVPDTITSWVVSALSLDENAGLGVSGSADNLEIQVFKPFFVKMNLPYSIIRGETVNIQATVFNYMKRPVTAKVTLENKNNEFEFANSANTIDDGKNNSEKSESHTVNIDAEDSASVGFLITARKLGLIDLKISAVSDNAGDLVVDQLLVKAEGQTQFRNKALLINLDGPQSTNVRNISIDIPANAVEGSQKVSASAMGDLLGVGITHVDDLLRMPYGCGEQNMVNLVPNIVIFNYLNSTQRMNENYRNKAINNIESGYQRQLKYKRSDGSFSAFGESDKEGSSWLTAYTLKTLQQASDIITVDNKVISEAASYLVNLTNADGSFKEVGSLHQKSLQSDAAANNKTKNVYITAYTLIALLQKPITISNDTTMKKPIGEVIESGIKYLEKNIDAPSISEDPYSLSIITYALTLANSKSAKKAYALLVKKAHEHNDKLWWQVEKSIDEESEKNSNKSTTLPIPPLKPIKVPEIQSGHFFTPNSLSVEMTSFALLSTLLHNETERGLGIVSWLVSQQNSNGGFASTQDTVLAVEALSKFAKASYKSNSPLSIDIDFTYPKAASEATVIRPNEVDQLAISKSNSLVYQKIVVPHVDWIQVRATGAGSAVVHISWQYNLLVSAEKPSFYLNPQLDSTSTADNLKLTVCTKYINGTASNMAVMDVELPSGYQADSGSLESLRNQRGVKRVDQEENNSKVLIYFDSLTNKEECLIIPAFRSIKVANNKPVAVSVYDYYDRRQAARVFYSPPASTTCEICDSNCAKQCSRKVRQVNIMDVVNDQKQNIDETIKNTKYNITRIMHSSATSALEVNLIIYPLILSILSLFLTKNLI